jgi:hypothetical protein
MRVFEAIGSGAALLTDAAPGLEMIFEPNDFATLSDDVVADVEGLLADLDTTQLMADRAHDHARGAHTYDHRVDLLLEIAADTPKRPIPGTTAVSKLARLIDEDVEVQRLAHDEVTDLADQLPDREVWAQSEREGRLTPASMDAAVITQGDASKSEELLDTARRYLYVGEDVTGLGEYLEERRPGAVIEPKGQLKRVDLLSESYRANPAGSPR